MIGDVLRGALGFVVPPLAGALIGYMTNWLAIRMLFRPLRAIYLFGVRLPFTPGIIPRRRAELAESIGRMVATDLLGPESIRAHISRPTFAASVRKFVGGIIGRVARMRLYNLIPISATLLGIERNEESLRRLLRRLLGAPRSTEIIARITGGMLRWVGSLSLRRLLPAGAAITIGDMLRKSLATRSRVKLGELLTPGGLHIARQLAERIYAPACRRLVTLLRRAEIRRQLERYGLETLDSAISRLTSLQRLFITVTNYHTQLEEQMPAIIDRMLLNLERRLATETTRASIIERCMEALPSLKLATLVGSSQQPAGIVELLVQLVLELFGGPSMERPLEEIVDVEALAVSIEARVGEWLRSPSIIDELCTKLGTLCLRLLRRHGRRRLVDILAVSTSGIRRLEQRSSAVALRLLMARAPEMIASLNIHDLVTQRINSLDVGDVETLILRVIARHLKWINLIGAVIGALIGGTQLLISRLV